MVRRSAWSCPSDAVECRIEREEHARVVLPFLLAGMMVEPLVEIRLVASEPEVIESAGERDDLNGTDVATTS